ncbi:MAG: MFS transporter, partial [Bacteroidaceae bacterium]|nr:MFS transporter [Bacteroidaceae bacterium]
VLEQRMSVNIAWSITFYTISALFIAFFLYHKFVLPRPSIDTASTNTTVRNIVQEFFATFASFFRKKHGLIAILFMLLYRLPEAQLVKLINPFLLDPVEQGGLGLSTSEVGFVYGTIGIIGLTIGGIIGGICASKGGLQRWLWPMALSLVLPNLVYVLLSFYQPQSITLVSLSVFIEQFGYGFGFTAYMLYLIHYSRGPQATAHYAICTAFMALGMMLPGMVAGWLQEQLGYVGFFSWVMLCCVATLIACGLIKKYDL